MKQLFVIVYLLFLALGAGYSQEELLIGEHGTATFQSEAPLEIIAAKSSALRGAINPETKSFAFSLNISSFQGFNSDMQRTHFLENYMEQKSYPQATFTGKLIEDITFNVPGTYSVRAKGMLDIHGVSKERIIRGTLIIKEGTAHLQADFSVPVADHGIAIPKIVKQKIAEQIAVSIDIEFVQGSKS
jgi:hypothetical protein